jgi:hypothetical protein
MRAVMRVSSHVRTRTAADGTASARLTEHRQA